MWDMKTRSVSHSKNCDITDSKMSSWRSFTKRQNRSSQFCFQLLAFLLMHHFDTVQAGASAGTGGVNGTILAPPLRVASFNIRSFGLSKMSKVSETIVKIMRRYDLVYIMETRDESEQSLEQLRQQLGPSEWKYMATAPLGRTDFYKEQHVFFYRPVNVTLGEHYVYKDKRDNFERPPVVAQFEYWSKYANSKVKVSIVGAHVDPDDVVNEMEALPAVISEAELLHQDSDAVILMGDLNADCSYMRCKKRSMATLLSSPEVYTSLVPDKTDTTVSPKTDCAYDRVILTVRDHPRVKVANVKPYNFDKELKLSYKEAKAVSDHYPVEFTLE